MAAFCFLALHAGVHRHQGADRDRLVALELRADVVAVGRARAPRNCRI